MPLESVGLSNLLPTECRDLLEQASVGRVVLSIQAMPAALPVSYRVVDDDVVFRTGEGGKLEAAVNNAVVAFEVDHIDISAHSGWSVLVVGEARKVTEPEHVARIDAAEIDTWLPADGDSSYVAISIERITGRRILQSA